MTKTLAQVIYSGLSTDEYAAVQNFLTDNGVNFEYSDGDPTYVIARNATASELTALETNVFGAAVTS